MGSLEDLMGSNHSATLAAPQRQKGRGRGRDCRGQL
jgi:hypothetical protein